MHIIVFHKINNYTYIVSAFMYICIFTYSEHAYTHLFLYKNVYKTELDLKFSNKIYILYAMVFIKTILNYL